MNTAAKNKKNKQKQYNVSSSQKKLIDNAAKKIVKNYGKTLKLLANE
jgi:hypothetical protein